MALTVVGIGGEPAAGKTTLMLEILRRLGPGTPFGRGLVVGTAHPRSRSLVLGRYRTGDPFAGTDRLSMAVSPQAERFLAALKARGLPTVVWFEGDRLFTGSFLQHCEAIADRVSWWLAVANPGVLHERHVARLDSQGDRFLRGRATKYRNLRDRFALQEVVHEVRADTVALADRIVADALRSSP